MKLLKSTLSLLLAIIMIFSCCSVAFAAQEKDTYDHLPQVYVYGFQSANIYYEDDPEKKPLFAPIDTERILGNLKNIGKYIISSIKNKEPDILYTCIYSFVYDSFGMLRLNPDGSNAPGVTVEPTVLTYDGDGKYSFYYDSRRSPIDIAPQLHEYIQWVKEDSGSDKIELVGSSYGADVVTSYLYVYQDDLSDLDSVLLCVPSVGGISFFGELLSGELNVQSTAFKDFFNDTLGLEVVADFLAILDRAGVLQPILDAMVVPVLREAVFDAILDIGRDVIATIPAVWVTIQQEHFEPAMRTMFGDYYKDADHEYAQLISDMTYYHENVMLKANDILLDVQEKNEHLKLNVICKYGSAAIPLSKYGNLMDDGLATLEVSSFGATCARYGEQLPVDYVQAKYPEYNFLSPDGSIDASTCLIPFTTWFIKGLGHGQKNEDYWKLIDHIVYRDLDVFTDPDIPQFLQVSDEDAERLVPREKVERKEATTMLQDIINLLKKIISVPVEFIRSKLAK